MNSKRFVVLEHSSGEGVHWDLLLEVGEKLASWRLEQLPVLKHRGDTVTAERRPDHRLEYLRYEGPISANRGNVKIWDRGTWRLQERGQAIWRFTLAGGKLRGLFQLRHLQGREKYQLVLLDPLTGAEETKNADDAESVS